MLGIIYFYVSWVCVFAFLSARKNQSHFIDEFKTMVKKNGNFVKELLIKITDKKPGPDPVKSEEFIAEKMYADATRLNTHVEAMVAYRYIGNHGWEYETPNYMYCLTHRHPVIIRIRTYNHLVIKANVIVSGMTVVDIVEINLGRTSADAQSLNHGVPDLEPVTVSNTSSDIGQEKPQSSGEDTRKPKGPEQNTQTGEHISDESGVYEIVEDREIANLIADNYLVDHSIRLDAMANEAVARGNDNFLYSPDEDLESGEMVLKALAALLVEKLNYKDAKIEEDKIRIYINLDSPIMGSEDSGGILEGDLEKRNFSQEVIPDSNEPDSFDEDSSGVPGIPEDLIPEEPSDLPE